MDRFSKLSPKTTLLFFVSVILIDMIVFNPIVLAISIVCALLYKLKIEGKKALGYALKFIFPLMLVVSAFNFLFSHYGETVLFVLNGNDFTFQSLFYGFTQALMLCSVLSWFSVYSKTISADKFLSLFAKFAPNLALIFSMVFSFVPRFKQNASEISDARKLLDQDKSKLKKGINTFSTLVTLTLEQSIETADSMKARGFGKKRTSYSKYGFGAEDLAIMLFVSSISIVIIVYDILGFFDYIFDPVIIVSDTPAYLYIIFAVLSFLPLIIDFTEDVKWHCLKRKI